LEFAIVIQIAPQMRILVAVEAIDLRRGIDGLARVLQGCTEIRSVLGWFICFS
jgi:hypothetical protein